MCCLCCGAPIKLDACGVAQPLWRISVVDYWLSLPTSYPYTLRQDVGACLAMRDEADLYQVARYLVKGGMSVEGAYATTSTPPYRSSVRTGTPDVAKCVKALRAVERKHAEMDRKGKADYEAAIARGETKVPKYIPLFM